jgi:hypothetical protein
MQPFSEDELEYIRKLDIEVSGACKQARFNTAAAGQVHQVAGAAGAAA